MGSEAEPSETPVVYSNLFQSFISEGKTEQALELSDEILAKSRRLNDRDFETEAWIRMERALLGAINRPLWVLLGKFFHSYPILRILR